MVNSTQKGFEVSQYFGSIQIWPHEAILRSFNVQRYQTYQNLIIFQTKSDK